MNGYLVLIRANMDDLPAGLFETEAEAHKFCDELDVRDIERTKEVMGVDTSQFVAVDVVRFVNGRPVDLVWNRKLDDLDELE